jgi:hypothetical protein
MNPNTIEEITIEKTYALIHAHSSVYFLSPRQMPHRKREKTMLAEGCRASGESHVENSTTAPAKPGGAGLQVETATLFDRHPLD